MNWPLLLPLLIAVGLAIGGWLALHVLAGRRDRANKRRELITQYLVEAYRRLESGGNRGEPGKMSDVNAWIRDMETSLADIQLFGTPKQVALVQRFAVEFVANSENPEGANANELLLDLRRELRKELGLDPVPDIVKTLRMSPEQPSDSKPSNG